MQRIPIFNPRPPAELHRCIRCGDFFQCSPAYPGAKIYFCINCRQPVKLVPAKQIEEFKRKFDWKGEAE